ncbi:hypothetical protein ACPOL_1125 [Acidisarcina polymorpha]|uniref:Uncharacterized protein n=1 Tax=Acidisarcina polymorpha TaxID=2211140 RepID=A0A2Z5FUD1_9BACT|nr:hypothetical protein ACPOL_1125 [Acidisarcina polymorpha]
MPAPGHGTSCGSEARHQLTIGYPSAGAEDRLLIADFL